MDATIRIALNGLQTEGPLGGNLNNPKQQPDARRAAFNGERNADGSLTLHRMEGFKDTAIAGRQNENPWHRMAAFMLLAGRTNTEIAAAAGVLPVTVSQLRAQRWFQELLATLANEHGEDIVGLIQSEAAASIATIVEIRDDTMASDRVRLAAATTLLEQAAGKPVQKNINVSARRAYADAQEELNNIMEEIQNLTNQ